MSITQHPSDETLAAFAAGNLDAGRTVVVGAHTEMCARCQIWVRRLLNAGGVLLTDVAPASMAADALNRALKRIEAEQPHRLRSSDSPFEFGIDRTLPVISRFNHQDGWKWMGPGIRWRPLAAPSADAARVFLLKAAAGTNMPNHTHTGTELTLVLQGAFAHAGGRYGPGDLDEADDTIEHTPVVEAGEECICLVAMDGKLQLLGAFGRLMQPFVRL